MNALARNGLSLTEVKNTLGSIEAKNAVREASTAINYTNLADCPKGVWVSVDQVQANSVFGSQDENVSQRMKELGFLPGTPLKVIGYGLFGCDPLAVQINGTKFALRRAEARKICITPLRG